mgnify:FL=1
MSTVEVKINMSAIKAVIKSDELWKFAANEWHKAYFDYVPHDTDMLRNNVKIKPKEIEHESPYSRYIYRGNLYVDPKYKKGGFTADGSVFWSRPGVRKKKAGTALVMKNGCAKWDVKAKQDKKDLLVVRSMQEWIKKNI